MGQSSHDEGEPLFYFLKNKRIESSSNPIHLCQPCQAACSCPAAELITSCCRRWTCMTGSFAPTSIISMALNAGPRVRALYLPCLALFALCLGDTRCCCRLQAMPLSWPFTASWTRWPGASAPSRPCLRPTGLLSWSSTLQRPSDSGPRGPLPRVGPCSPAAIMQRSLASFVSASVSVSVSLCLCLCLSLSLFPCPSSCLLVQVKVLQQLRRACIPSSPGAWRGSPLFRRCSTAALRCAPQHGCGDCQPEAGACRCPEGTSCFVALTCAWCVGPFYL